MTTKDQTGDKESDTQLSGEGSDGAAGQDKEVEGLKAALRAEREKRQGVETKLARLEGTVEGLKSGQPSKTTKEPKTYTRNELRAMVNAGSITEDQMDAVLEDQIRKELKNTVETTVEARVNDQKSVARIEADIERYVEAFPDVTEDGSDTREKVAAEFKRLVKRGLPDNLATELTAMENALGQIDRPVRGRKKDPETHQEGGSGSRSHDKGGDDDGMFKGIAPKLKAFYQKQIDRGFYKGAAGQKALKAELETARARLH